MAPLALLSLVALTASVVASSPDPNAGLYSVGVGISDITGPAEGILMMGYAKPGQTNKGIHMRLFARAFIVDDGDNRLVYVSADIGMMGQLVKIQVVEELEKKFNGTYSTHNVILSGIHTHSGPGGYLQYTIFDISTLGFVEDTFMSIVGGIVKAIETAHNSMTPGHLYVSVGELTDASISRSPTSYLVNPQEERTLYEHDTDKNMTVVRIVSENGTDLGMLNWFAVHATSMNNTNHLISGDNKGYASYLFEEAMNPNDTVAGQGEGPFVAAFAQSNCGDVSPNTAGPLCQDTGLPCEMHHSTCNGRTELCYAQGPGKDMFDSTRIIGQRQFEKAMELYKDPNATMLKGPVQFNSQQVDMSKQPVVVNGTETKTCPPALGYSFAAGTTDGPGEFDFTQGTTSTNPFWNTVVGFIEKTSQAQIDCHAPKPILLSTGQYHFPYDWHPTILETQMGRIGQLGIIAVPGEFTTMSGRRMRNRITKAFKEAGVSDVVPVISGLSNVYSHYIATFEEYQAQRYEAASTLYGPNTLEAYIQQFEKLSTAMIKGTPVPAGPTPPNLHAVQIRLTPPVVYDEAPSGYAFGDVLAQPYPLADAGETIIAKFVSGHPRNNAMLGGSFLTVEKQEANNTWRIVAKDSHWSTKYTWDRVSLILGTSEVTVTWETTPETPPGIYRISHSGYHKPLTTPMKPYTGYTQSFKLEKTKSINLIKNEDYKTSSYHNLNSNWLSYRFMQQMKDADRQ